MEKSGSSRRVWAMSVRIGGLIGVVGLLALLFALSGRFERVSSSGRPAASGANDLPELRLGGMTTVAGSGTVMLSLYLDDAPGYASSYGKDGAVVVNHLFRGAGGDRRWLYPGSGQIIVRTEAVAEPVPGRDGAPASEEGTTGAVKAFLYEVVRQDSDKDGELTWRDRHALAVSAPDGSRLTEVFSGFERMVDFAQAGSDLLAVHLRRDGRDYLATLDLRSFRPGPLEAVVPPR